MAVAVGGDCGQVMYYYYAGVSLFPGWRPWWKRHLTKLQIAQFAVGGPCAALYIYYHFAGGGAADGGDAADGGGDGVAAAAGVEWAGCTEVDTTVFTGAFDITLIMYGRITRWRATRTQERAPNYFVRTLPASPQRIC